MAKVKSALKQAFNYFIPVLSVYTVMYVGIQIFAISPIAPNKYQAGTMFILFLLGVLTETIIMRSVAMNEIDEASKSVEVDEKSDIEKFNIKKMAIERRLINRLSAKIVSGVSLLVFVGYITGIVNSGGLDQKLMFLSFGLGLSVEVCDKLIEKTTKKAKEIIDLVIG